MYAKLLEYYTKGALTHHRLLPVVLCYLTATEKRLPCVKGAGKNL